jgi:hypothetical protein
MPLPRWLGWALALIVIALAIFAVPARFEGPILIDVSQGHAIAVLDAVAIVPLLAASALIYGGLWAERERAAGFARRRPMQAILGAFAGGTGLGLLLASAFSAWFWWWAVGAALFGASLVGACVLLLRQPGTETARSPNGGIG